MAKLRTVEGTIIQRTKDKNWEEPDDTLVTIKNVHRLRVWWSLGTRGKYRNRTLGTLPQNVIEHVLSYPKQTPNNLAKLTVFQTLKRKKIQNEEWEAFQVSKLEGTDENLHVRISKLEELVENLNRRLDSMNINIHNTVAPSQSVSVSNSGYEQLIFEAEEIVSRRRTPRDRIAQKEFDLILRMRESDWTYQNIADTLDRQKSSIARKLHKHENN